MHVALHYLGVVRRSGSRLATRGSMGPLIESMAPLVDRLSLVAWEAPEKEREITDKTDYELEPLPNIDFCSLGEKGTLRGYLRRRSEVHRVVRGASATWDVLVFRLVNRRAELVFGANRCPRIVSWIGGHTPSVVRATPMPLHSKIPSLANAWRTEMHVRRIIRASGLAYANSEVLRMRYPKVNPAISILRTSSRHERFSHEAQDRLTGVPRFLIAGRIAEAKGVFEALDAFGLIRASVLPEAELHVVGDGESLPSLAQRAEYLGLGGCTNFHGFVPMGPELFAHFMRSDVLLFLSHEEALPRVIWEALAHSVLVVTTPVGALPDVFTHGKELLFVEAEPRAVASAVRTLRDDPALRHQLIRRGFARAREVTAEASAQRLISDVQARWPELGGATIEGQG